MIEVSLAQVDLLQKLVSAAVVCLSPAVAWATLRYSRVDRQEDRRQELISVIRALEWEVGHVGSWTRRSYDESSHDPNWYNASFQVVEPSVPKMREFNRTVSAEDYGDAMAGSLAGLEESIDQLNRLVVQNREATGKLDARDGNARSRLCTCFANNRPTFEAGVLTADALAALRGIGMMERNELPMIYERNKRLHIDGIGGPGEQGKLHSAVSDARTTLAETRERLRSKREPRAFVVVNVLAVGLFVVGCGFLIAFGMALGGLLVPAQLQ